MEWISVNEQMPYIGQDVLTYNVLAQTDVNRVYRGSDKTPCFSKGWRKGDCFEITHWMPLPEPPKK